MSEEKQSNQKRLGSPTPWKNPTQVLRYLPPGGSKIHMPADHPQLNEIINRGKLIITEVQKYLYSGCIKPFNRNDTL